MPPGLEGTRRILPLVMDAADKTLLPTLTDEVWQQLIAEALRRFDADEGIEHRFEVLSAVGGEGARDVLPDSESRVLSMCRFPHFPDDPDRFIEKHGLAAVQPGAFARDGHVRAGRAKGDDIYRLYLRTVQFVDIAVMFHERQAFCCHPNGERFNFAGPNRGDSR